MKRKHSILRAVVLRFIGYFLGMEIAISVIEDIFNFFVFGVEREFPYDGISFAISSFENRQIALIILWILTELAIYCVGIALFARSISRKVSYPAARMAEGFAAVSNGSLDVTLDFETETEFKEMRDSFNLMTRKLKAYEDKRVAMENDRMRIFSHIAHDLKTPITTITGYAGALASEMVEDPVKQQEYHLAIKAKADQMNELIDQLLSYSKLGTQEYQMKLSRADLAELLRAACASLFAEMEGKRMELTLNLPDRPVLCELDSAEMNRAIGNLLTNAIRHNRAGSLLSVSLAEEADRFVIEIADNGEAIPSTIAENLFEPFISGDDSRSSDSSGGSGSGLGLAIVKKIVERHSGEVLVTASPAPYTKKFVLCLPKKYEDGGGYVQKPH